MLGDLMFKPIPKKLLIHTAILKTVTNDDGGEITTNDIDLTYVRIEANKSSNNGGIEVQDKTKFLMFFDVVNSVATDSEEEVVDVVFKQEQRLSWDGYSEDLIVRDVAPIYGVTLHHYEVELS